MFSYVYSFRCLNKTRQIEEPSNMDQITELDALGILRQTKVPPELAWMSDAAKSFVLDLFLAGEEGMSKRAVDKLDKQHKDLVFNVTIRSLAEWLTDRNGRPCALALTWQGIDVAKLLHQIARNQSKGFTEYRHNG